MKPKIGLITLGVNDFDKSLAFYRDGLGFPVHQQMDDTVFFKLEGTWLGLYLREKLAEDARISAEGNGFSGVTLAHNESSKDEVDATFAKAITAGATEVKKPEEVFWGGYSGYFADPDGHLWEIAWNPFMDIT